MRNLYLFLRLAALLCLPFPLLGFQVNGIEYEIRDGKVHIIGSDKDVIKGSVIITETINYQGTTYPIVGIDDEAFHYCYDITDVSIPASVIMIGDEVFTFCDKLSKIDVDPANPNYSSQDGVLFDKAKTVLMQYPIGNIRTNYTVPATVVNIDFDAFVSCPNIKNILLPSGIKTIGEQAFMDCANLETINLPEGLTTIDVSAFENCVKITNIVFPKTLTTIENAAFLDCTGLTNIALPESLTKIGADAFYGCINLKEIHVANKEPLAIDYNTFMKVDKDQSFLYVPIGSKTKYENDQYWGSFKNILEEGTTGIDSEESTSLEVYSKDNIIYINGAKAGSVISVFNNAGVLIRKLIVANEDRSEVVMGSVKGVFIVRVNNRSFKIMI